MRNRGARACGAEAGVRCLGFSGFLFLRRKRRIDWWGSDPSRNLGSSLELLDRSAAGESNDARIVGEGIARGK